MRRRDCPALLSRLRQLQGGRAPQLFGGAGARRIELFAGYATEIKGDTMPAGGGTLSITLREPYGVCARIVAYNHPLLFAAGKLAAPLATGNTLILKPAEQAPLSALRMVELIGDLLPPGVLNLLNGGPECGAALTAHPLIEAITLVGSPKVGRLIARDAAARLKHVALELGGKNPMVVYPDADFDKAVDGAVKGMNFAWCGQSCGSTSRLFLHEDVHDRMLAGVIAKAQTFVPGLPTDPVTNMGALISEALARGVPVLTGLSETHRAAFDRYADGMATILAPTEDAVMDWCNAAVATVAEEGASP